MTGPADSPTTWLNRGERGALWGIRAVFWLATAFGRWPSRLLIRAIALYYCLFDRKAAGSSREWLRRVHGRAPSWRMVYGHILRFSQVTLDRIFLLRGNTSSLRFEHHGTEHLRGLVAQGRGAVLLGAHLGSYEALRTRGDHKRIPINILGYFQNAKMINALFQAINPDIAARVIHIGEDPVGVMVQMRDRIEGGELVAVMGDRVGLNEKTVTATFFDRAAQFPTGPFLLASLLKCPVLLVFGLYFEPNRYVLHCEPFADLLELPRRDRQEALEEVVQRFATRLEHYCRAAPDNWFNFYDFWRAP